MNRSLLREQVFKLLFRVEFNPMEEMPEQEELFTSTSDDDFSKQTPITKCVNDYKPRNTDGSCGSKQ